MLRVTGLAVLFLVVFGVVPVAVASSAEAGGSGYGLVLAAERVVERVRALLERYNVSDPGAWEKLEEAEKLVDEIKALVDAGDLSGAVEKFRELGALLRGIIEDYVRSSAEELWRQRRLLVEARLIEYVAVRLRILANKTGDIELYRVVDEKLSEALRLVEEARDALRAGDVEHAEKLLGEAKEIVREVHGMVRNIIRERIRERLVALAEKIADRLEEKASELEEKGFHEEAAKLRWIAEKIREAVANATPEQLAHILRTLLGARPRVKHAVLANLLDKLTAVIEKLASMPKILSPETAETIEKIAEEVKKLKELVEDGVTTDELPIIEKKLDYIHSMLVNIRDDLPPLLKSLAEIADKIVKTIIHELENK